MDPAPDSDFDKFLPAGAGLRIAGSLNLLHPTNYWRLLEARNTLKHRLLRSPRATLSMLETLVRGRMIQES